MTILLSSSELEVGVNMGCPTLGELGGSDGWGPEGVRKPPREGVSIGVQGPREGGSEERSSSRSRLDLTGSTEAAASFACLLLLKLIFRGRL